VLQPHERVSLTQDWAGRNVVIIGGGPSLRGFDFEMLRRRAVVVAVNDAFLHVPWANVAFSSDVVWINRRAKTLKQFQREILFVVPDRWRARRRFRMARAVRRISEPGLSDDMGSVRTGENSGYAALGMAIMRGASKVALLGFDMNGPGHWHNGYGWECRFGVDDYPRWVGFFDQLADAAKERGVEIINCNPDSAIRCFRFGAVEEVLG
jgi:hypothetical protein